MNNIFTSFLNLQQPLMKTAFCITVIGLPLSIAIEFSNNSQWLLYFKLYPHLILFSLLAFGVVLISLNQAINLVIEKKKLMKNILIIVLISIFLTYIEVTSDNMLLLELNNRAESTLNLPQETIVQIQQIPESILDTNQIIRGNNLTVRKSTIEEAIAKFREQKDTLEPEQKQGYYTLMKNSLSYSTWENENNVFSISRIFYMLSFFSITTVSLISCILLFIYSKREIRSFEKYLNLLTISSLVFMTWIPLRYYYNLNTLNLIFGSSNAIGNLDAFAFLIYPIYVTFLCLKIYQNNQDLQRIGAIITIFLILTIIGRFLSQAIDDLFGLNSNLTIWIVFGIPSLVYYFSSVVSVVKNE